MKHNIKRVISARMLFLVCNRVTRRPCWWSIQKNVFGKICIKINRVHFPEERNAFVFDPQHGRRDVTCKPAIAWANRSVWVHHSLLHFLPYYMLYFRATLKCSMLYGKKISNSQLAISATTAISRSLSGNSGQLAISRG